MRSFEFAIQMELDGEKYYMDQAEKYKYTDLHTIFMILAKDERKHADILRDRVAQLTPDLLGTRSYEEYKNVFQDVNDFNSTIKENLDQLDVYHLALKKEKDSIDLYKEMLSGATDEKDKEILQFLIKEEETHYTILDEISSHVIRAEEWVESAEFGIREEY